ncbi:flagellar associated protein [Trypanosoma rangeli]|uniref:Flagellar associated protein n=1 Tax=Trypanosoma rangeli TaxID=5698 RepID=A0A3R7N9A0_TRYRA|nr:flagellar associated protein [Trypanosoma rangeli]RNE98933.1 flagellar associated protein [Trypanosoma rangeli]|eukprot:RNE98933.1 flagellar associated protein [Trypanosoma rangeli]
MSLENAFYAFASFGGPHSKEMDNAHFSKMLKETKIIGKAFTSTDADLLFNKVKAKGARKITYAEFADKALPEIATRLKKSVDEVIGTVANSSPEARATKADAVKFHDDKNMYTGVYKAGGPTNVDRNPGSLAGVVDRRVEQTDVRGTTSTQK